MGYIIMILITLHFIFDWILQPRYIGKGKKEDLNLLLTHMLINILPFTICAMIVLYIFGYDPYSILGVLMINLISHFLIDLLLPPGNTERQVVTWTAVDQILHINILIILLQLCQG